MRPNYRDDDAQIQGHQKEEEAADDSYKSPGHCSRGDQELAHDHWQKSLVGRRHSSGSMVGEQHLWGEALRVSRCKGAVRAMAGHRVGSGHKPGPGPGPGRSFSALELDQMMMMMMMMIQACPHE